MKYIPPIRNGLIKKLKSMYKVLAPGMANTIRVDEVLELAIFHL